MSNTPDPDRLKRFEERLKTVKDGDAPASKTEEHYSMANMAWRMVIELVVGLGLGFGIGFGLDVVLGTKPWLMVLFTLLGFVAGVKTMIRSANEIQEKQMAEAQNAKADT
ncbi:MAG: AtpZ/AtpI family protein [Halocynthiibacter sp.]